ncbi:hypothetical protein [Ureibacillus manganicus]|uniref:Uncharacterized protein n=1 Tax=Ureibacillus manganicus DSM 26584 TaxID=1384049 RepID=A0A0A3I3E5_9BACL|nr:hypothetical protein [Ureibacillus manganicus]KGR78030.1 hypothetical protein CD29_12815 [Ureibacillus manganicus DSM 26584]
MNRRYLFLLIALLSTVILVSCSNEPEREEVIEARDDQYGEIRSVAWDFIQQNDWHTRADENWESAKVEKILADDRYEILDPTVEGKEVFSVSFKDIENVVVGTPQILVDPKTKKVVGYMLGE